MIISQLMGELDPKLIKSGKDQPKDFGKGPELFRTLSPVEIERVMTFPDMWTLKGRRAPIPKTFRGFVMGNSCPPLELVAIRDAIESLTS
jgi:site-specific DNA-cytosine methylase